MVMPSTGSATALLICAAAFLIAVPTAAAQPAPPPCAPEDRQCPEQNPGAGIARDVLGHVQDGVEQAGDALEPRNPADGPGIMVNMNGVLTCMPLNKPIPPGAVVTSPTGNGVTSYC